MLKILLICVARTLANVSPKLHQALSRMIVYTLQSPKHSKDTIDFIVLTEQPHDDNGRKLPGNQARRHNMNKIRKYAIDNYDYIVKMDGDMIPPPHALVYLIATSGKYKAPIVTSLTPERPSKCGTDAFSQVIHWNNNKGRENKIPNAIAKGKPFTCTGNGGEAFMLMTRDALNKIIWPPYGSCGDFAFWREVHKQGIKVVCTPRIVCAHEERGTRGYMLVRGVAWIVEHWKDVILKNLEEQRAWFHGLPYTWWHGSSPLRFLQILPIHLSRIDTQRKEPNWFTYPGQEKPKVTVD